MYVTITAERQSSLDSTVDDWVLRVDGLGKIYGRLDSASSAGSITACWDVSFDVAPGEALGVIGESGSGKSTLLRCIAGDESATAGTAYLRTFDEGRSDLLSQPASIRRQLRVDQLAVVYQNPAAGLDLDLSAGGNVADRLTAAGWRHFGRIRSRASELLERTEVPLARMDDQVRTFSGGMQQRVQIAKALANRPPVLLLDEPTTGLDASVAAGVLDLLRGLLEELDVGAVVVSHDFGVIEMLTRRVIVMQDGRVVEAGLTDQLFEDPQHPYSQQLVAAARG